MRKTFLILLIFMCLGISAQQNSPWGVMGHPTVNPEWQNLDVVMNLTKDSGIKWMRADFGFGTIYNSSGDYNFEKYDALLDKAEANGVQILPILQGFDHEVARNNPQLVPLYNHPDEWRQFIRTVVQRYHKRVKHWEIWNEQDGGFWKPTPNAAQYVKLLKIAYEEIKNIDPTSKVVTGGTIAWNAGYLDAMYNAGAKGYFDIVAFHPYGFGPDVNEKAIRMRNEVMAVFEKHNDKNIPTWITECGGTSFQGQLALQQEDFVLKAIHYALDKIGNKPDGNITIGLAVSPRVNSLNELEDTRNWLPGVNLKFITLDKLQDLDPTECQVLIGAEGLNVDRPLIEPFFKYVERGGLLLGANKVPFFTVHYQDENGAWLQHDAPKEVYVPLRLNFDAQWKNSALPVSTTSVSTSEDAKSAGMTAVSNIYLDRYLNDERMLEGDKYYPIIQAFHKGAHIGDGMSLYTYKDKKGGVLLSTISVDTGYTPEGQANLLQRVYLSYLSLGVDRLFWYDMHNDGQQKGEREHNFGLLNWDWTPKPAYHAYKQMTFELGENPIFKERLDLGDDNIFGLLFERKEDAKKVLAIWATKGQQSVTIGSKTINFEGEKVQFLRLEESGEIEGASEVKNTVYVDFGGLLSPAPWNNLDEKGFSGGRLEVLNDELLNPTTVSLEVTKGFMKSDVTGVETANNGLPTSVTKDLYVGEGAQFQYSELKLRGFDPRQTFDFTFFGGSGHNAGNRVSSFKVIGANEKQGTQDAALNEKLVAIEGITPDENGVITIEVSMGGKYGSGYYFLNAMIIKPHAIENKGDLTIHKLLINDTEYDINKTFTVPQDYKETSVKVEVEVADNMVVQSLPLSIDVSKPGLITTDFQVESQDGELSTTYTLKVEKKFQFDELIVTRWNNTMSVFNKENHKGFQFSAYQWYRNGEAIKGATKQFYSAGKNGEWLDENDEYFAEVTEMTTGQKIRCWESTPKLKRIAISAYPNPVSQNETLTLDIDADDDMLKGAKVTILNSIGTKIGKQKVTKGKNYLNLSGGSGVYFLTIEGSKGFKNSIKIMVK